MRLDFELWFLVWFLIICCLCFRFQICSSVLDSNSYLCLGFCGWICVIAVVLLLGWRLLELVVHLWMVIMMCALMTCEARCVSWLWFEGFGCGLWFYFLRLKSFHLILIFRLYIRSRLVSWICEYRTLERHNLRHSTSPWIWTRPARSSPHHQPMFGACWPNSWCMKLCFSSLRSLDVAATATSN